LKIGRPLAGPADLAGVGFTPEKKLKLKKKLGSGVNDGAVTFSRRTLKGLALSRRAVKRRHLAEHHWTEQHSAE
jgi:hypothetical protein